MTEDEAIEAARATAIDEIEFCVCLEGLQAKDRIIRAGMLLATLRDPHVTLKPLAGAPFQL